MPTIQYVQGQPFLIPDEVTELPTGTQPALPVTQDWYPAGYDNQQVLPAQPDMWANVVNTGKKLLGSGEVLTTDSGKIILGPIAAGAKLLASVVLGNGEKRAQLWPERMLRSGVSLADQARRGEVLTGPGLRREDFTDIPPSQEPQTWIGKKLGLPAVPEQPLDPLIERAQDVAGMQMGTTMFAKPGTASVGSGAFRKGNVEVKPYEYRGEHTAPTPEGGSPLYDVTTNAYPKDFYGPNGLRYYAPGNEGNMDAATYNKIVSMKNKPDELVKIYRAIPWEGKKPLSTLNGNNERSKINPGDWVTISKEYAKEHGEGALNGQYAITMKKVPAKELFTQGDSFHEWGWHPILLSESGKIGAPLAALEKAPMFYSNVENAVKNAKTNSATADQWLGYLKNQPGVKPEELEWTLGQLPQGKITKDKLAQHIAENKVQLGEVWKGGNYNEENIRKLEDERINILSQLDEARKNNKNLTGKERTNNINKIKELNDRYELLGKEIYSPKNTPVPTKYQSYQLPGGENYRELLLTLPSNADRRTPLQTARELFKNPEIKTIYDLDNNQMKLLQKEIDKQVEQGKQLFRSSHWDEPNVLAHVRMNDRNIPDVGKSLHIEEIQSDWHQAGRKQGYKGEANNQGVPNAPFKKTWDELALKRTINEAVRNGYDAISWTPGEAQAARYDLSKHIDELHYQNRTNALTALDHNGKTVIDEIIPKEKVSDYIGKEAAEKLFKTEPDKTGQHLLEGEDLKIGGEGMKAFYDKMMVDKANALAKKFGGKVETKDLNTNPKGWHIIPPDQNVYGGDTWLVKSKDYNSTGLKFWSKARAEVELEKLIAKEKKQPVHVLKLTSELKKAVSEKGFPLFTGGIPHVPPAEPTFDERWRDRVPDEMTKRDQIKDLLEQQKIRNLPLDYTPPERKFEGRPVHLTKVDFTPEF